MVVYPFKANDHENYPYVGMSRMGRFRMVVMCKGKRKLWLRGSDDVLVVGFHMVWKRVKVSSLNNVTSFLALCFSFLSLDSSSQIFIATPLFSFSSFSFILSFSYFFFSFFLFHTHTFLFIFPLLTTFQSSQLLSLLHAYNMKF
jgi:hypothetical protein